MEKLQDNKWLAERENAGWNYRIIFRCDQDLEIGKSYDRSSGFEIDCMISLCEICSELLGNKHDDQVEYEERLKEDVIAVLAGDLELNEFNELYEDYKIN
ncbi:MAG: hypothetical protein JSU85_01125 [Candidatus Zixiibacteriota bacterium]|nr:MAG: hypothetical protein JSU85_01125 [candidate division Zixibacteria bacterium]